MKVYKKRLPDGIRKKFAYEKGVKVKILNSKYFNSILSITNKQFIKSPFKLYNTPYKKNRQ